MFTGAHFHLLVNHAPIFGSLFALALLVASYFTSADVLRRTAFVVLIGTAIAAAAANLSGDAAEEAVKGLPGIKHDLIEAHSEMGDKSYYLAGALGVLALAALVRWRRRPIPAGVTVAAVLATAFVGGAMVYTGLLGGRIRHTEIRPGATPADALIIEPPRQRGPRPAGD
jgi:MYXO-CTERM domain-containing protein